MQNRPISTAVCFALVAAAACHDSASPKTQFPPTHPSANTSARILGLGGRPFGVRVAPTGDVLVTEQDLNRAVHLDSLGTSAANVGVGADPGDVVANRAGTRAFVSGFNDGTVSIVDLTNNTVTKTVQAAPGNAYRLALSSDESRLFVTSTDGNLYTVNTSSQTVGASKFLGGALQGLTLDHNGQFLFVSATSGSIWRLDAGTLAVTRSVALSCTAQDVALSTDDAELYVACENGSIAVLDATTLQTKTTIDLTSISPFGLAVTPDDAQLYVTSPLSGSVTIIDRAARSVIKTLAVTSVPRRVAFNARGNLAYVANEGNWVDVIQ
jgi:YVTN family beta-propeller protein